MLPPSRPFAAEIIDLSHDTPARSYTKNSTTTAITRTTTITTERQIIGGKLDESFVILSDETDAVDETHAKRAKVDSHDPPKKEAGNVSTRRRDDFWDISDDDMEIRTSQVVSQADRPKKDAQASSSAVPGLSQRTSALLAELGASDFWDLSDDMEIRTSQLDQVDRPKKDAQASSSAIPGLSQRTSALLAELDASQPTGREKTIERGTARRGVDGKRTSATKSKEKQVVLDEEPLEEDDLPAADPVRRRVKTKLTEAEKQEGAVAKKAQREQEKQARLEDKAAEKARKEKVKEEKAREKQMAAKLAQANKSRTDKKASTPEMIVDLPLDFEENPVGKQIRSLLRNVGVDVTFYASPIPNIIKWRRKVTAVYNEGLGYWEPVAEHIRKEIYVLCVMSAKEFVDLVRIDVNEVVDGGQDLNAHILKLKSNFEDCKSIYLIEGLTSWMRKNRNVRNRAYQAEVIHGTSNGNGDAENQRQTTTTRRRKPAVEYIDEDMIEDALLRLQLIHKCLVFHTATALQTAEWVSIYTQHMSTIPYRAERMNRPTAFCMDVGQVKTGIDKSDTFVKLLQEIVRVTPPVAYGIAAEYPDVKSLVKGFEQHGPMALQDLKKTANKNGAFSNASIGPALSKRIYKIFMGLDPNSHDV